MRRQPEGLREPVPFSFSATTISHILASIRMKRPLVVGHQVSCQAGLDRRPALIMVA